MRVVRLGKEPSEIGADVRAAISAWGAGDGVLGGIALFGVRPPGGPRELDAVLVLPHGIVVVVGADLPAAALRLEAPVRTPWTVDGWPLLRSHGAINPAVEALESASALARGLQSRGAEPLPVSAIVAVGPYVERITQPTSDLHRGVRVVHPSTTTMLAAVRELTTYQRACGVEPARRLIEAVDARAGGRSVAELTTEGFPDAVAPDMASANTMLIPKIAQEPAPGKPRGHLARLSASPTRNRWLAVGVAAAVVLVAVVLLVFTGGGSAQNSLVQQLDGVHVPTNR